MPHHKPTDRKPTYELPGKHGLQTEGRREEGNPKPGKHLDTGIAEIIRDHGGGEIVHPEANTLRAIVEGLSQESDRLAQMGAKAAAFQQRSSSKEDARRCTCATE